LNISMPKEVLHEAGIEPLIGQRISTAMP